MSSSSKQYEDLRANCFAPFLALGDSGGEAGKSITETGISESGRLPYVALFLSNKSDLLSLAVSVMAVGMVKSTVSPIAGLTDADLGFSSIEDDCGGDGRV